MSVAVVVVIICVFSKCVAKFSKIFIQERKISKYYYLWRSFMFVYVFVYYLVNINNYIYSATATLL